MNTQRDPIRIAATRSQIIIMPFTILHRGYCVVLSDYSFNQGIEAAGEVKAR